MTPPRMHDLSRRQYVRDELNHLARGFSLLGYHMSWLAHLLSQQLRDPNTTIQLDAAAIREKIRRQTDCADRARRFESACHAAAAEAIIGSYSEAQTVVTNFADFRVACGPELDPMKPHGIFILTELMTRLEGLAPIVAEEDGSVQATGGSA